MISNKIKKQITNIKRLIDYNGFIFTFLVSFAIFLCSIPWIFKQRRSWQDIARGSKKALIIQGITLEKVRLRGYEYLLPFRNPSLNSVGFFDPANSLDSSIDIATDFYIVLQKAPKLVRFFHESGFEATSIPFRELSSVFRIINYCVHERIGVLRAYKHDYAALRAYLVSCLIKIPYIVDISGNFELIRRLSGKDFYFQEFHKLPIIGIFARRLSNWLYGLPLRHASRVLARNKFTYEHAFALGTPVERLSLLRISNFDSRFNRYNHEQLPPRPMEHPYFLFVGRLVKMKYPIDVIEAFDLAAHSLPDYQLILIGDGGGRRRVEERIDLSQYKDRIFLRGACSSEEVFQYTAHAAACICPLSGSTLVEAMLCGIPVIAYDVAWHSEVVFDEYTGFLVPFRNTAALADKMSYVGTNYDIARIVGMRGRDLVRVAFDKEKISQTESVYYTQAFSE